MADLQSKSLIRCLPANTMKDWYISYSQHIWQQHAKAQKRKRRARWCVAVVKNHGSKKEQVRREQVPPVDRYGVAVVSPLLRCRAISRRKLIRECFRREC